MKIIDRYMLTELRGPFLFGLSAFTLIFAATQLLAISRLYASEHPPLGATIEYFLWQFPQIIVTVVPMAMLLGVLLSLQRLSGESELTAMKAGGVGLVRAVRAVLIAGFIVSLGALALAEGLVPFANDRASYIKDFVISHSSPIQQGNLTFTARSPSGGRQLINAAGFDSKTQTMLDATVIEYDRSGALSVLTFARRARYEPPSWRFEDGHRTKYSKGGDVEAQEQLPSETVRIDVSPGQIIKRGANDSPELMSRAQVREVLQTGALNPIDSKTYQMAYAQKLARPFASFVFTLIAIPFGLRPIRGGGGTGLGFGLAVAIVFVYFVIATIISVVFTNIGGGQGTSTIGAWLPNVLFTIIGALFLRRVAAY